MSYIKFPSARFKGMRGTRARIAWFKHYGTWPDGVIDHIDRNTLNNDISNLRIATHSQNCCNLWNSRNTSGEKNVVFIKCAKAWAVKVKSGDLIIHATASHKISAVLAARLIRRLLHGEFAYQPTPAPL